MTNYPFLDRRFLQALADSGSVGPGTGWLPEHVSLRDNGHTLAFMPTYHKQHSWGEYVFDWAWANAYQRNGLNYYPKLVSAIPFSPATGPRVALAEGVALDDVAAALINQVLAYAEAERLSSWHMLFPDADTLAAFNHPALLPRSGVQFHWFNRNYDCFDAFLAGFVARKRKMVKRERLRVAEQNIEVRILQGSEIDPALWRLFFHFYQRTYLKRSGSGGYLTEDFFLRIGAEMPEHIAMAVAYTDGAPVACALYFYDETTLYGRYWGCLHEYDCLHFELCYYQGIDFAIANKLRKFDAGAQGEHKILRGFEPVETHSLHWIKHPGFAEAIAAFLDQERRDNCRYIDSARSALPYKQGIITAS